MTWVAVAIGGAAVVGGAASYMGGKQAGDAASGAAKDQMAAANSLRQQELGYADQWGTRMRDISGATPQELNILGQSYNAASRNLAQQQRMMDAIDPALMEASKQALSILRGGPSAANAGVMAQRQAQRSQMVDSLRQQYGPGAENSSMGQRMLSQFDMETQSMAPQMLNSLMGVAGQGQQFAQGVQRGISGMNEVGQGYSALQGRMLGAEGQIGANTLGALSGTSQNIMNTAGGQYAGAALQGQGLASLGNNLMNGAAMYGSYSAMGPRYPGPSTPTGGGAGNPAAGWNPNGMQQPSLGQAYSGAAPTYGLNPSYGGSPAPTGVSGNYASYGGSGMGGGYNNAGRIPE